MASADGSPVAPSRSRADLLPASAWLLTVGLAAGCFAQGGVFLAGRSLLVIFVLIATVLAFVARPPAAADVRFPPVAGALLLVSWVLLRTAVGGVRAPGVDLALTVFAMVGAMLVCRRLDRDSRDTVLLGLVGIGVAVAVSGWLGVLRHAQPWALPSQGLWRASSTLTYPNATAALLVSLALVTCELRRGRPDGRGLAVALCVLLTGVGATLSRAGGLSLLVGLAVLAVLTTWRGLVRAGWSAALGAAVALCGLLPSMPTDAPPRYALAVGALLMGVLLAVLPVPTSRPTRVALGAGAVLAIALLLVRARLGNAAQEVARVRASLVSSDRAGATHAAWQQVVAHPLIGVGPGRSTVVWTGGDGTAHTLPYVHDEYLQTLVDLGAIGLTLLLLLLAAVAVALLRSRTCSGYPAAWAGVVAAIVALGVHSTFDFLWHVAVIPVTAAALVALVCAPLLETTRPGRTARRPTPEGNAP